MTTQAETEIIELFANYAADFSNLGIEPILHYFCRPCMAIAPQGVFTLNAEEEIEQVLESMFENLKMQGYVRSDWVEMQVKILDEHVALASNVAAYYDAEGKEIERAGGTYVLYKSDEIWKIAVITVHSPDKVLALG